MHQSIGAEWPLPLKRRTEIRHQPPSSMPVEVHIMGDESLNILYARDISLSGLGVQVPHGFRDADLAGELDLVVTLPGSRSFLAKGIVRHRNNVDIPNFFGVEFTALKPLHYAELRKFLRRLRELEAGSSGG